MGWGVSKARIVVTIGPLKPDSTIVSPTCKVPFTKITSIVVPRPSITLTSRTVHSNSSFSLSLFLK